MAKCDDFVTLISMSNFGKVLVFNNLSFGNLINNEPIREQHLVDLIRQLKHRESAGICQNLIFKNTDMLRPWQPWSK